MRYHGHVTAIVVHVPQYRPSPHHDFRKASTQPDAPESQDNMFCDSRSAIFFLQCSLPHCNFELMLHISKRLGFDIVQVTSLPLTPHRREALAFEAHLPSEQRPPLYVTQPSIPCLINSKISSGAAKYYLYRSVSSVKGILEWSVHGLYTHL
jgi:hypothetical protein